jgi:putative membrane protein
MRTHSFLTCSVLALGVAVTTASAQSSENPPAAERGRADRDFMMTAAAGGMAEVELGQLAAEKATRPEVKQFAQMLVNDHSQANEELKTLAQRKNVSLPSGPKAEHDAEKERLSRLSGPAFDDAYVQSMVKDHEKDVELFSRQASSGSDPEAKAWAAKILPKLKQHLAQAKQLAAGRPAGQPR